MRIIRLQAEGFKRLIAVDISPEGNLIEGRGDNGNGKSSVLDAIYSALAGAGAAPEKPVREGEEAAVIRLDLGELIVTRYFTATGTTGLKVTTPDGASYSSAQTMLDKLVGAISFDPLEFRDLKPAEQAEELRKLVDIADPKTGVMIDLEAVAKERGRLYAKRRDVNRDGVALKGRIEAAGGVRHVPDNARSRDEIKAELASAGETNAAIDAQAREQADEDARRDELLSEVARLRERLLETEGKLEDLDADIGKREPLAEKVDVAALSAALDEADRIEDNRRANAAREALIAEFNALRAQSGDLTKAIESLDKARATAIAAAKMPVDGLELSIDEDGKLGVLFDGVPFSQASDAERLRVSAAVAMAANPELRVLRLKDASLLDKRAVETLREMATANDFQIWAEFVGDEGPGIIMEAGEVRRADKPEPLDKPRQRKAKPETEEPAETAPVADKPRLSNGEAGDDGLLSRMGEPEPERRKPRAMTEFSTKPRS